MLNDDLIIRFPRAGSEFEGYLAIAEGWQKLPFPHHENLLDLWVSRWHETRGTRPSFNATIAGLCFGNN